MLPLKIPQYWLLYLLVSALVLLLFFLVFGEWGLLHYWRLSRERANLERRNVALQRDNELLREQIYRLRHDNSYLEKVAREHLGLAKDGEVVYRFSIDPKKSRPVMEGWLESSRSLARKERP